MAAVIAPDSTAPWNRPDHAPSGRVRLRVIEGGRSQRPATTSVRPLVGWVAVLLAALAVGAVALLVSSQVLGADAVPVPASTAGSHLAGADASTSSAPAEVVVQPGDTLWSIARALKPSGDVRPLVDRLVERTGGVTVVAGQRLDVSGLLD